MQLFYIILLLFYLGTTQTFIYGSQRKFIQSLQRREHSKDRINEMEPKEKASLSRYLNLKNKDANDVRQAKGKAEILQKAKTFETRLNHGRDMASIDFAGDPKTGKEYYHMDPVLNQVQRRHQYNQNDARRRRDKYSDSYSSSMELKDWKDEFQDQWLVKKFEAVNSTDARGDVVNMVAARPWGVPCGDPNQHDLPWGTCMLPMECDPEYRIYRGDSFCGRTQFVCCALQLTNYDLYEGFDVSFADTSFATDSAEKQQNEKGSKENKKRKKQRAKKKRLKERRKRKRQMKQNIKQISLEIRKILNRSYRNASHHRKKRTLLLKKYIKDLKKRYREDRKSIRDIHTKDMNKIDEALEKRLNQIRDVNTNFLSNSTFREIIVNGTISKTGARMLVQAYPELKPYLRGRLRRDGGGFAGVGTNKRDDYLEYDIEYGALYY